MARTAGGTRSVSVSRVRQRRADVSKGVPGGTGRERLLPLEPTRSHGAAARIEPATALQRGIEEGLNVLTNHWLVSYGMKKPEQISSVVVKVVERCNLNCSYCYMYNHADQSWRRRPSVMSEELFTLLMRRIREYCDEDSERRMAFTFHGGDPLLLGASRLAYYATIAREIVGDRLAHMALQTNATLITREWIDVFQEHNIYIGVSLDGPPIFTMLCGWTTQATALTPKQYTV